MVIFGITRRALKSSSNIDRMFDCVLRLRRNGRAALDVGCSIGVFSALLAKLLTTRCA
jgi:hypothetical protein